MARLAGQDEGELEQRAHLTTRPHERLVLLIRQQRPAWIVVLRTGHPLQRIPLQEQPPFPSPAVVAQLITAWRNSRS